MNLGHSGYLTEIYDVPIKYRRLVKRISKRLITLRKKTKFEAIAFRGSSGAALAYPISVELGIPLIHIRKVDEDSHGQAVESSNNIKNYIIIDDVICSGSTMNAIIEAMKIQESRVDGIFVTPKCIGIVLYSSRKYGRPTFYDDDKKIRIHYWGTTY